MKSILDNAHQKIYVERRARLAQIIRQKNPRAIVILDTAEEKMRNRDSDYPYRHDSDFYYLTGFTEPQAVLVMLIEPSDVRSILFCRPKDMDREIWDGFRLGPEAAKEVLSVDQAYDYALLVNQLPDYLGDREAIYIRLSNKPLGDVIHQAMQKIQAQARSGISAPQTLVDLESIVHEMRLFKDAHELDCMRKAAAIAAKGHIHAMQACKPGLREYHLEAELLYTFRYHGAQSPAYNSIVAAGANACTLHHRASDALLRDGDLCLIDAGCELDGYASDITRTFPINGTFSGAQRAVYDVVLAAQEAAISQVKTGQDFMAPHEAALKVLTQGLLDLEILKSNQVGGLEGALENKSYQPFYMHRTSHWIGMDVHDVGAYRDPNKHSHPKPWRELQNNMVLTIEPGLYIRPNDQVPEQFWNIGIRIEDDVVVRHANCEILSRDVPVKGDEIEYLMKHST